MATSRTSSSPSPLRAFMRRMLSFCHHEIVHVGGGLCSCSRGGIRPCSSISLPTTMSSSEMRFGNFACHMGHGVEVNCH